MKLEAGQCPKCKAPLGRSGKCPRLCEPVDVPAPAYTGSPIIGGSHVDNLLRSGPGWIG